MNPRAFFPIFAFVLASVCAAPLPGLDDSLAPEYGASPIPDISASLAPGIDASPTPDFETSPTLEPGSTPSPDFYAGFLESSSIPDIGESSTPDLNEGSSTPEVDETLILEIYSSDAPDLDTSSSAEPRESYSLDLDTSPTSDLDSSPSPDLDASSTPNLGETSILDLDDSPAPGIDASSTPEYEAAPTPERNAVPTPDLDESPTLDLAASPSSELAEGSTLFMSASPTPDLDESPIVDLVASPSSELLEGSTLFISASPTPEFDESLALDPDPSSSSDLVESSTLFISASPTPDLGESPSSDDDVSSSPDLFVSSTPETESTLTSQEDASPASELTGSPNLGLVASSSPDLDNIPVPSFSAQIGFGATLALELDGSPTPELSASSAPTHSASPSHSLVNPFPNAPDAPCALESAPIDFENYKLGMPVAAGAGFTLTTRRLGPFASEDASAVFDSRKPTGNDDDLGSPNEHCRNATGPGVGIGGVPGSIGENCIPLGNLLIAHEGNLEGLRYECARCPSCSKCAPDANAHGAEFQFTFTGPGTTVLHEIVVLDVDEPKAVSIINHSGAVLTYGGWGDNGKVVIPLYDTKVPVGGTLTVRCIGSCGIAHILRSRCTSYRTEPCTLKTVDFNEYATGARVVSVEDWILDTTRLGGGWARDSSAVFNTTMPTGGDTDLGAPNELCAIPGPGVGIGGQPGSRGANCQSLGQVLIAHTGDMTALRKSCSSCPRGAQCDGCEPSDHGGGARFRWTFTKAVRLRQITMMDLNDVAQSASIEMPDTQIFVAGYGKNSLRTVGLGPHVLEAGQSMTVKCVDSCAIVKFDYFPCK